MHIFMGVLAPHDRAFSPALVSSSAFLLTLLPALFLLALLPALFLLALLPALLRRAITHIKGFLLISLELVINLKT